ncbi:MAG: membrane-bound lytic murein transglycosylase MltF [Methylotenera sp.]|nr:MAG: membrane-bound lytic murein transglycosylase MltF [Methylotenera sp.]
MPNLRDLYRVLLSALLLCLIVLLTSCNQPSNKVDDGTKVVISPTDDKNSEVITFVTLNSPNTYYVDGDKEFAGLEYDLTQLFIKELGGNTQLKLIVANSINQVLPAILNNKANIAAADVTITDARREIIDFSIPYQDVQQVVVYNIEKNKESHTKVPKKLIDLAGLLITVPAGTSFVERLIKLQPKESGLIWEERLRVGSEQLLQELARGEIDYTIADSHLVSIMQNYYPNLGVAFAIGEPEKIAWALPKNADPALKQKVDAFFSKIKKNGTLRNLIDRYHGNAKRLKPVDVKAFLIRSRTLLPKYKRLFQQAQEITGLDWRLIAAISYQESHWDTFNTSPTNVRGLMMLTESTADLMKVTDRLDPKQSIPAGAKYINMLKDTIPERVPEPDRTYMALASYNIGYAHVEDARVLAQRLKLNPDRWADVKKTLVMLNDPTYYVNAKYGYASGGAPVIFVESIRSYYNILARFEPSYDDSQSGFKVASVGAYPPY